MSALHTAVLLALPSSIGAPARALDVVLALKAGSPAVTMTEARCEKMLWRMFCQGLVDMRVREVGDPRWTRSREADALSVVRARFDVAEEDHA